MFLTDWEIYKAPGPGDGDKSISIMNEAEWDVWLGAGFNQLHDLEQIT